jgi:DNA-binding transcriptional LysR family regulator
MATTISVNWIIKIRVIGYIDMRFTLRQLQVFVAVAQQESVSRAAGCWPLAIGGQHLDHRTGAPIQLPAVRPRRQTPEPQRPGNQLLPQAVALLDQAKEIEDLLNGKSGFGSLAVGATLTIGNYLATLLIGSFMQRHPKAR